MKGLSKIFEFIAKILSIPLILGLLLYFIDGTFHFMPEMGTFILQQVARWGALILAGLIALAVTFRLHPILAIIVILLLVAVVVFEVMESADILKDILNAK